jgi:hypothetical protein
MAECQIGSYVPVTGTSAYVGIASIVIRKESNCGGVGII